MHVYENLQKLYAAAWLIHQRTTDKPYLKDTPCVTDKSNADLANTVQLYQLNTAISNLYQEKISKIVGIIKHKVPITQTGYIYSY